MEANLGKCWMKNSVIKFKNIFYEQKSNHLSEFKRSGNLS